jgi:integrase/recombinase XerD
MPMDAIFEAYLAAQRRRRPSPLTLKAIRHALGQTQRWLDEHELAAGELSLLGCEEYFDELLDHQAVSTVRRQLAYVRAAYRYAQRHDLVERDPTGDVRLPRLPDHDPAIYSNMELRQLHAAIRTEREQLVFFLFAFAGLRLGEVAALEWRQVEFERWQIRLAGKGGKLRLVPLHPALTEVLREQQAVSGHRERLLGSLQGRRLSANTLGRSVRELVDRAGVEVDSPSHAFRRTVATVMYENGVRARVIERIMGWAPRQMYERHYLRVADEQMHDAIRGLYHDDPICDRQQQTLQPRAVHARAAEPVRWLAAETARLELLEQQLHGQTG